METASSLPQKILLETHPKVEEEELIDPSIIKHIMPFSKGIKKLKISYLLSTYASLMLESLVFALSLVGQELIILFSYGFLNSQANPLIQASFGLLVSYLQIFYSSLCICCMDKLCIAYTLAFGEKDYLQCRRVFTQGFMSLAAIFLLFILPLMLFSSQILVAIGVHHTHAHLVKGSLISLLPYMAIRIVREILKSFCTSQGIEAIFGRVAVFVLLISILLDYFLVVQLKMKLNGVVIALTVFELINLAVCFFAMRSVVPTTMGFEKLSVAWEGFLTFFIDCIKYAFASYCEVLAYETVTYFMSLTHDDNIIAAYTACTGFTTSIFTLGLSFANICRTRTNTLISIKEFRTAKNFFRFFWLSVWLTGACLSVLTLVGRQFLAEIYASSNLAIKSHFLMFLTIYLVEFPFELTLASTLLGVRIIQKIDLQIYLNVFILCILHPAVCIFLFMYSFSPYYYFFSQVVFIISMNAVCTVIIFFSKWTEFATAEPRALLPSLNYSVSMDVHPLLSRSKAMNTSFYTARGRYMHRHALLGTG